MDSGKKKDSSISSKKKKWTIMQIICLVIGLACICYLGWYYYQSITEKSDAQALASEIQELRAQHSEASHMTPTQSLEPSRAITPDAIQPVTDKKDSSKQEKDAEKINFESLLSEITVSFIPKILPYYQRLYHSNTDLAGWLRIKDTVIDYPVVQYTDNAFYLSHGIDKEYARCGTLFIDYRNHVNCSNSNIIIYGHNMKDGSMFHEIMNYTKESYYLEHPIIQFDTLYEVSEYEIVSAFYTQIYEVTSKKFKYYQWFSVNTEEDFTTFVKNIKELSEYDIPVVPTYGDSFLTLSTCSHHMENGRFVVIARKKAK